EGNNVGSTESLWSAQQVVKREGKCDVQAHALWGRSCFPQSQHRFAGLADPVERRLAIGNNLREFESQRLTEERHRALEVADRQVSFKEIANRYHDCTMSRTDGYFPASNCLSTYCRIPPCS